MMADLPASVVQTILGQTCAPGAVLLRGAGSILRGEPQNDIDIFVPRSEWSAINPFGRHHVVSDETIGAHQRKLQVREAATGHIVSIDVFHLLTWRGIPMVDVTALPTRKLDGIKTTCLHPAAEVWLTVLKNVLHGTPTPKRKLADFDGHPAFSAIFTSAGPLKLRLDAALAATVWSTAAQPSVSSSDAWRARRALILLRLLEAPLGTVGAFFRWLVWRLYRKFLSS